MEFVVLSGNKGVTCPSGGPLQGIALSFGITRQHTCGYYIRAISAVYTDEVIQACICKKDSNIEL